METLILKKGSSSISKCWRIEKRLMKMLISANIVLICVIFLWFSAQFIRLLRFIQLKISHLKMKILNLIAVMRNICPANTFLNRKEEHSNWKLRLRVINTAFITWLIASALPTITNSSTDTPPRSSQIF